MKLNGKYRLRKVGDTYIVVRLGDGQSVNFSRLITVNDTGAFIFKQLENGTDMDSLVAAIMGEYEIDEAGARDAAETYLTKLVDLGIAER